MWFQQSKGNTKPFTALTSKAFGTEIHSLAGPGAKNKKKIELKNSLYI